MTPPTGGQGCLDYELKLPEGRRDVARDREARSAKVHKWGS